MGNPRRSVRRDRVARGSARGARTMQGARWPPRAPRVRAALRSRDRLRCSFRVGPPIAGARGDLPTVVGLHGSREPLSIADSAGDRAGSSDASRVATSRRSRSFAAREELAPGARCGPPIAGPLRRVLDARRKAGWRYRAGDEDRGFPQDPNLQPRDPAAVVDLVRGSASSAGSRAVIVPWCRHEVDRSATRHLL